MPSNTASERTAVRTTGRRGRRGRRSTRVNALRIVRADLKDTQHQAAVLEMTRAYAQDPMGNGRDLPENIQGVLIDGLRAHPTTLIFLALHGDDAVGIESFGFVGGQYEPEAGAVLFREKKL